MTSDRLFLIAHMAGRAIAIDSAEVESVVDLAEIVPAPGAAAEVLGLAALRSRVVTVLDPFVCLGLAPDGKRRARAVITKVDDHLYALPVDLLEDIAGFATRPLPTGLALDGRWGAIGRELIERDGEALLVIDLRGLIPVNAGMA